MRSGVAFATREGFAIQRAIPHDRIELLGWTPDRGLSHAEVNARLARFGPNSILERAEPAWKALVRETARDPMLWFLVATAGLYAILGERAEAWTLFASAIPLVAMDALLNRRAQASIEGLRSRLHARVRVLRDGRSETIAAALLVPGDLVHVETGEHFPADGVVVGGDELQVDESVLTGESYPVRKRPLVPSAALAAPTASDAGVTVEPSLDGMHWAQAGTRLLTGEARVRVLLTGGDTLYGGIVRSSRASGASRTPLQRAVSRLVMRLVGFAGVLCVLLAVIRLRQGFGWVDAALSALTLAVAALPEEFPVVVAVFFGVGAHRLAHRKALVRRAASVENIGRVTCICSDKTGTITRGELTLAHLEPAAPASSADEVARIAAYASRAESGDPLDEAILRLAISRGVDPKPPAVVTTFPFTEDRRRETVILARADGSHWAALKGAPELLLSLAAIGDDERAAWTARVAELARGGHKVIACASKELGAGGGGAVVEPDRALRFEGLLAFEDPVREGVADAVAQCREAGIRVVMVTGDHRGTASAVAREIGLGGGKPRIVTGEELETRLAEPDARRRLAEIDLVVRALPAQKLALVRGLQAAGEQVAVTGDGVNDVPALQAADVGIAMSERASRSAREASAIVLLDDCFATIVAAIAEGRQLFANLKRAVRYLLTVHIPLMLTAALIPLAGYPLLFLPIHIVWLELVIHPSALLAFQDLPSGGRLADGERRGGGTSVVPLRDGVSIALVGLGLTALVAFGFVQGLGTHARALAHARSMALAALCFASAGTVAGLSGLRTPASRWIVAGTLALSAALIELPALASALHVTPLHSDDWALALAGGLLACLPIGVEALFARRAQRRTQYARETFRPGRNRCPPTP